MKGGTSTYYMAGRGFGIVGRSGQFGGVRDELEGGVNKRAEV